MVIKITDQRLLNLTGGIVQGMSGSPILQNNKLIGAVTHVFVKERMRSDSLHNNLSIEILVFNLIPHTCFTASAMRRKLPIYSQSHGIF